MNALTIWIKRTNERFINAGVHLVTLKKPADKHSLKPTKELFCCTWRQCKVLFLRMKQTFVDELTFATRHALLNPRLFSFFYCFSCAKETEELYEEWICVCIGDGCYSNVFEVGFIFSNVENTDFEFQLLDCLHLNSISIHNKKHTLEWLCIFVNDGRLTNVNGFLMARQVTIKTEMTRYYFEQCLHTVKYG